MLHSFAFANFRSFLERAEVSFTLTDKDAVNGWDRESTVSGQRLSTAMAVIGPNASGKTTAIQAIAFVAWFARYSFASISPEGEIPISPHFNGTHAPSEFEAIFDGIDPGTLLRYSLSARPKHVVSEVLERRIGRGQWRIVFRRERKNDGKYTIEQDDFGLDQAQAENVRQNVSLISWAAQFGVSFAQQLASVYIVSNVNMWGRIRWPHDESSTNVARFYAENPVMRTRMVELLRRWDLGLSDVTMHELESRTDKGEPKKDWFAMGVHLDAAGKTHTLPFITESSGTKAAYELLSIFLPALEGGGFVAFDELESDLHPHMVEPLLDLFSNPETNPKNAQIMFTCHAVEVLRVLQKSQITLVEKDGLESHAWRLDSMEGVRSDDNRVAKYLAGAYGAVPRL